MEALTLEAPHRLGPAPSRPAGRSGTGLDHVEAAGYRFWAAPAGAPIWSSGRQGFRLGRVKNAVMR